MTGEWHDLGHYAVERDDVIAFAREWDPQPFHLDDEAARQSVFGVLTGSSIHLLAAMSKTSSQQPTRYAVLANLSTEFTMPAPMKVGDTILFRTQPTEKRLSRSRPGCGVVNFNAQAINQDNTLVMDHRSVVLVACRENDLMADNTTQ